MSRFQKNRAIRAGEVVTPHHPADHSSHHEKRRALADPFLAGAEFNNSGGLCAVVQPLQIMPIAAVMVDAAWQVFNA
jgi:hypothetical protein